MNQLEEQLTNLSQQRKYNKDIIFVFGVPTARILSYSTRDSEGLNTILIGVPSILARRNQLNIKGDFDSINQLFSQVHSIKFMMFNAKSKSNKLKKLIKYPFRNLALFYYQIVLNQQYNKEISLLELNNEEIENEFGSIPIYLRYLVEQFRATQNQQLMKSIKIGQAEGNSDYFTLSLYEGIKDQFINKLLTNVSNYKEGELQQQNKIYIEINSHYILKIFRQLKSEIVQAQNEKLSKETDCKQKKTFSFPKLLNFPLINKVFNGLIGSLIQAYKKVTQPKTICQSQISNSFCQTKESEEGKMTSVNYQKKLRFFYQNSRGKKVGKIKCQGLKYAKLPQNGKNMVQLTFINFHKFFQRHLTTITRKVSEFFMPYFTSSKQQKNLQKSSQENLKQGNQDLNESLCKLTNNKLENIIKILTHIFENNQIHSDIYQACDSNCSICKSIISEDSSHPLLESKQKDGQEQNCTLSLISIVEKNINSFKYELDNQSGNQYDLHYYQTKFDQFIKQIDLILEFSLDLISNFDQITKSNNQMLINRYQILFEMDKPINHCVSTKLNLMKISATLLNKIKVNILNLNQLFNESNKQFLQDIDSQIQFLEIFNLLNEQGQQNEQILNFLLHANNYKIFGSNYFEENCQINIFVSLANQIEMQNKANSQQELQKLQIIKLFFKEKFINICKLLSDKIKADSGEIIKSNLQQDKLNSIMLKQDLAQRFSEIVLISLQFTEQNPKSFIQEIIIEEIKCGQQNDLYETYTSILNKYNNFGYLICKISEKLQKFFVDLITEDLQNHDYQGAYQLISVLSKYAETTTNEFQIQLQNTVNKLFEITAKTHQKIKEMFIQLMLKLENVNNDLLQYGYEYYEYSNLFKELQTQKNFEEIYHVLENQLSELESKFHNHLNKQDYLEVMNYFNVYSSLEKRKLTIKGENVDFFSIISKFKNHPQMFYNNNPQVSQNLTKLTQPNYLSQSLGEEQTKKIVTESICEIKKQFQSNEYYLIKEQLPLIKQFNNYVSEIFKFQDSVSEEIQNMQQQYNQEVQKFNQCNFYNDTAGQIGIKNETTKLDQFNNPSSAQYDLGIDGQYDHFSLLIGQFCYEKDQLKSLVTQVIPELRKKGIKNYLIVEEERQFIQQLPNFDQAWFISGNQFINTGLEQEFVQAIQTHLKKKKGLMIWADNTPFIVHSNLVLKQIPLGYLASTPIHIELNGNDYCNQILNHGQYNTQQQFGSHYLTSGLNNIHEGITICSPKIISPTPPNNYGELEIIGMSSVNKPCIMVLPGNKTRGRIVIDCGFTKLYEGFWQKTAGTLRYVKNCYVWLFQREALTPIE